MVLGRELTPARTNAKHTNTNLDAKNIQNAIIFKIKFLVPVVVN